MENPSLMIPTNMRRRIPIIKVHHLCHIGFLIGPDLIQDLFTDHLITDFSVQIIKFAVDAFPFFFP